MTAPGGLLAYRPCGACGAYVDADTRCKHWRPEPSPRTGVGAGPVSGAERTRQYKARRKAGAPPLKPGPKPLTDEQRAQRTTIKASVYAEAGRRRRLEEDTKGIGPYLAYLPFLRLGPGGRPAGGA